MNISKEMREILRPLLLALILIVGVSFLSSKNKKTTNFSLGLSDADYSQDTFIISTEKLGIKTPELLLVEKNSFKPTYPPFTITSKVLGALMNGFDTDPGQEIREYIVESKDSLSSIAAKFDVSVDTIVWANNIKSSIIQPGDKLIILPVSGVMHLVKTGDTVQTIAKTYRADENDIVIFNDLSGRNKIFEGEVLVIPSGKMSSSSSSWVYNSGLGNLSTNDYYGQSHSYPYGQCTWWVAQMRAIPSWGNAIDWINNAKSAGYSVCKGRYCPPQVGAVIYLKGHRVYGHVGYVERTEGGSVVFSEMNYLGLGVRNLRSLPVGSSLIQGYIY